MSLEEFTPARDALAKRLRSEKDSGGAATVKALRKPTAAAWALNQLPRRNAKALGDFLDLGRRLRAAQRAALEGKGAAGLRDLGADRRRAVGDMTKKALKHLGGGAASDAQRDAISTSLEAALASEDLADALVAGRLTKPLEPPSGFGEDPPHLTVVRDAAGGDAAGEGSARDQRRSARAERRAKQQDDGEARRRDLERALDEKAAALERAKVEAQAAAREAAAARAEVSRLQDELVSANGRAKAAAERARVAQWTQSQAQQELDAASRAVADSS